MSLISHTFARQGTGYSVGFTVGPTVAINTTGAKLLVAMFSNSSTRVTFGGTSPSQLTDSAGNTWTYQDGQAPGYGYTSGGFDQCQIRMAWSIAPMTSTTHTFLVSGAPYYQYGTLFVAAFSDTVTSFNVQNGHGYSTLVTSMQAGSVTPGANGALLIAAVSSGGAGAGQPLPTFSINSSFAITDQFTGDNAGPSQVFGGALSYFVQTTAAAINPTWTLNHADYGAATILTFATGVSTATINVVKTTTPAGLPDTFNFTTTGGLSPSSFALTGGQTEQYANLSAGTYGVAETTATGFRTDYTVSNGNPPSAIAVVAGDVVTVTVNNTLITPPTPPLTTRTIRRVRQSPHLWDGKQNYRMFYKSFELLGEVGGPRADISQPLQFALEVSTDGGNTFGPRVWQDASMLGQYKFRVIWRTRFSARDCVVRVSDSNEARIVINDLLVDAEQGLS